MYCRSNLGDKISDYEDLWTQDNVINAPLCKGPLMSSFRPDVAHSKRPDVISETRKSFLDQTSIFLLSFSCKECYINILSFIYL